MFGKANSTNEVIIRFLSLFKSKLFYINTAISLPEPLTKEEEQNIFSALLTANETEKENLKQELIVHNLRLVVYIAKRFESTGINLDDLISIGTIGLIKAANSFCPDRNIKLATYASRCIENEILMYMRKIQNQKLEMSIDEPLNVDWDGNELLLSDIMGTDSDCVDKEIEDRANKSVLISAVESLPERERNIMELRFGLKNKKEHTQKEVADLIGISQSYISRLEKKIIKKLKKRLESYI